MSYAGTSPEFVSVNTGNVSIENNIVYLGDKDTDGSFRLFKDGTDLKIQVRVASVWEDRDVINV